MNLRNTKPSEPYDFRIDRQSALGNPYRLITEIQRDAVCDRFDRHFEILMTDRYSKMYTEMQKLLNAYMLHGKLRLFCWCAPKRCHGLTYKRWLEKEYLALQLTGLTFKQHWVNEKKNMGIVTYGYNHEDLLKDILRNCPTVVFDCDFRPVSKDDYDLFDFDYQFDNGWH
jgi:hypothetical protein